MFVFCYSSDPFRTPINSTCDSCRAEDETRVNMLVWLVHPAGQSRRVDGIALESGTYRRTQACPNSIKIFLKKGSKNDKFKRPDEGRIGTVE